jgi:hypothetical protein
VVQHTATGLSDRSAPVYSGEPQLRERLFELERENRQLRQALDSRIVIEQAKGVLAERYRLEVDRAFVLLRQAARSSRRRIHELAAEVVQSRAETPAEIEVAAPVLACLDESQEPPGA